MAGLFHDIATPVFKHCIDFMNGDSEIQESTEERTLSMIASSPSIIKLLKRDSIDIASVCDYKMYPIADNDTPQLSADRFEYTFSGGLSYFRIWELDKIEKIYNDVEIGINEKGIPELVFKHTEICEEYINIISQIWPQWINDADRTVMQFLADICKSMNIAGYLSIDDLYNLSESEVISKIINCDDYYLASSFSKFMRANKVYKCENKIDDKYCVNVKPKIRYIVPLVNTSSGYVRISTISPVAYYKIKEYLDLPKGGYYTCFDFDFKPYKSKCYKKTTL